MNDLIGQHLGPYRIIEPIGTGGMATVYKAYQPSMDRYVALKVIASYFAQDETFLRRFRREARAVARLEHPHILPVYDYGEAEGRPYLVMRYMEAGTLKERMEERPLPLKEVNRLIGQVGSALDYAHRMGVIHRDVKPSNVLLDREGNAFLTDFGLARMVEASVQLTGTGVGIGTPAYMSPEQGRGERVDHRADIYSLGVMLFEMVTGRVPYEAETPIAVVVKHITDPLPLPRSIRSEIPEGVERVILRALAKDPNDRFQTAMEMVQALDKAVRAAEAAAPTEPTVEPVPFPAAAAPGKEGFLARVATRLRAMFPPDRARVAGWAGLGVVVLAVLLLFLSRMPLRVRVRDGQLEVVRVVKVTPTQIGEVAEPTVGPVGGATEPTVAPTVTAHPTARPTATPGEVAEIPPAVAAMRWEQLSDPSHFSSILMPINVLAVAPDDPDTVFAGTYGAGIYVSRDGGQTWELSNEGLGKGTVGSIVMDPNDSNVVYAALFDQGGVYKSTDGGRTWRAIHRGLVLDRAWNWTGLIYLDPTDSSHLYYTSTTDGFYASDDSGETWQLREEDCPSVTDLAIDPDDGDHLYAGSYGHPNSACLAGVYESRDGGQTWKRLTTRDMARPSDEYGGDWWHVAVDPQEFTTVYAGGQERTFKSTDGGQTWSLILDQGCSWLDTTENAVYCGRGGQVMVSRNGGMSWQSIYDVSVRGGQESHPFATVPGEPNILYAGSESVMKSTDGGQSWFYTAWPFLTARTRLTVTPWDGNQLFLSTWGWDPVAHTVFRSNDGGAKWFIIASGGWGGLGLITFDTKTHTTYRTTGEGLYRSNDDGATWEKFGTGYLTHTPMQLAPDPDSPEKLWLVGECGTSLALSKDNGETFTRARTFPDDICQPILLVHPEGQRMYIVAWGSFYRSDDGGETWHALGGLGGIYRAAALDPSDPDVVYVGSTHKGALKTEDGGLSWRQVNAGLTTPSINDLSVDPAHPDILYAATDGGAFVSVDGGERWWPIQEGLGPNPVVYSIAVDPSDSSKVYAATPDGIFRLVGAPPTGEEAGTPTLPPTPDRRVRNPENDHLYRYVGQARTWHQAKNVCAVWNGHLVAISSASENEFVLPLASLPSMVQ